MLFTGQPEWRSLKEILPDNPQQSLAGQGIEHIQVDLSSWAFHRAVEARTGRNSYLVYLEDSKPFKNIIFSGTDRKQIKSKPAKFTAWSWTAL